MKKPRIRSVLARFLVFLTTSLISICLFQTTTQDTDPIPAPISPPATPVHIKFEEPQSLYEIYTGQDSLFHHGYKVQKVYGNVINEYPNEHDKSRTGAIPISYAVVKKNARTIAIFDGVEHAWGDITDFGLFDLLGDKTQQLIISLTRSRGGRHWVISLKPKFRVLLDSAEYGVGREEFSVIDLDKDDVYEISLPVTAFYQMQDKMYIGEIPLPEIIFKYDPKQQKYLPANHLFPDYALRDVDEESLKSCQDDNSFSGALRILLDYVYVGREKDGWALFDTRYRSPDKEKMRSRIKELLNEDPVYEYLYNNRHR